MEQEDHQFFGLSYSLDYGYIYQQTEGDIQVSNSILQQDLEKDEEEVQQEQINSMFQQNNQGQLKKRAAVIWNSDYQFAPYNMVKINNGLTFTKDGALRMSVLQSSTSFNYQQQIVDCIEDKKDLRIIDFHLSQNPLLRHYSIGEKMNSFNLSSQQLDQKDEEFQQHLEFCYDYLNRTYIKNKENSSQMFQYQIARYNYRDHQSEFVRSGFSKSYLELLGLDQSSFSSIYLRKYQVDLIKEKNKITQQTIQAMDNEFKHPFEEKYIIQVQTFDGFFLNLTQRKHNIQNEEAKEKYLMFYDYSFFLIEFDIDIQELQKLIEYRLKILQHPNTLSIEQFIQKELCYRFEDVEYSIHSETFIDKFYRENLEQMMKLQEQLIKQKEEQKPCSYRLINQNFVNQFPKKSSI
ncbi:hypothetical protein ABPG74_006847 [Tetrahymena malaccensis]